MSRSISVAVVLLTLLVAGCGGASNIGESCDNSGSLDECVAGAICTNVGDHNVCYKICVDQDDCPPGWNCNGVALASTKSCQPIQ